MTNRLAALAVLFGLLSCVVPACSEPTLPSFGNPNGLDWKNIPSEGGVPPLVCGSEVKGRFANGCPTFANDLFPSFRGTGKYRCADAACHGGTNEPRMNDTDAAAMLGSLQAITLLKRPYIAANDADGSMIMCSLQGLCGSAMPKAPGVGPTNEELCVIEAWLDCGAPP